MHADVLCHIWREVKTFLLENSTKGLLINHCCKIEWVSKSSYPTPVDFCCGDYLKSRMFLGSITTLVELKDIIWRIIGAIGYEMLHSAVASVVMRLTYLPLCAAIMLSIFHGKINAQSHVIVICFIVCLCLHDFFKELQNVMWALSFGEFWDNFFYAWKKIQCPPNHIGANWKFFKLLDFYDEF